MFFFANIVAVLSMAFLALDRLGVILTPFFYYRTLTKFRMKIILVCTWIASLGISIVYFFIGYIRFLVVFSFSTVALTLIFMLITMVLLRRRLKIAKAYDTQRRDSRTSVLHKNNNLNDTLPGDNLGTFRRRRDTAIEFTQADQKITKTFLWMLVLFIMNYVPCIVLVIYMNICVECDCNFVHIMRDIIWFFILASPFCRALNFLMRLKTLREQVQRVCFQPKDGGESMSSLPLNNILS